MTIYKITIGLILGILVTSPVHCQIDLGIKAGLNNSTNVDNLETTNEFENDKEYRTGYHIGIVSNINLSEKFTINPEMLYSQKGYKNVSRVVYTYDAYGNPLEYDESKYDVRLNYIVVPVLFGYEVVNNLYLYTGPEFGYLFNTNANFNNGFEFSLAGGTGYNIGRFTIELRYIHGLSSLTTDAQYTDIYGNPIDDPKFQNRLFQLSLGLNIL